jgi:hypothetical protein
MTNLGEECDDDSTISKLSASQRTQGLGSRLVVVILDVDFANTVGLSAAPRRARYLHLLYGTVLAALFLDILDDF